jgi:hypothetical protein
VNADLRAEAEAAAQADPIARLEWGRLSKEEQDRAIVRTAEWRVGVEASAQRAGFASIEEYIDLVDPIPDRSWPIVGPSSDLVAMPDPTEPASLPDLADVATIERPATLDDELVEGFMRPGKLILIAASEGVGKSYVRKELEIRLALGLGALFGHYAITRAVRVGTVDEENGPDEEYRRDEEMLGRLGLTRDALAGRYRRQSSSSG